MKKSAYQRFIEMTPSQRAADTAQFDGDFDDNDFQKLDAEAKATWQKVKRKRGRPMVGSGAATISISVERGLLSEADKLAKQLGVSRAKLVAQGLMHILESASIKSLKSAANKPTKNGRSTVAVPRRRKKILPEK